MHGTLYYYQSIQYRIEKLFWNRRENFTTKTHLSRTTQTMQGILGVTMKFKDAYKPCEFIQFS